jgi:2-succinyl-5-enolpyruvyl-6-hydroxy-3-cyclohexene-1-carboxylate synthase
MENASPQMLSQSTTTDYISQGTQAEASVEMLNANGVECIFFNPGSDTTPVQVAILKYKVKNKKPS